MSAKVDVLSVIGFTIDFWRDASKIDTCYQEALKKQREELEQARADIAELIAAAKSLYESERKWPKKPPETVQRAEQIMADHNAKIERLRSALAAVTAQSAGSVTGEVQG